MVFVDEVGSSLKGVVGTTWAPAGQTPEVSHCCKWNKLSTIGGISHDGRVFSHSYAHSICKEQLVAFLEQLAKQLSGKLLVIWDGASIHRAHVVKEYRQSQEGSRITLLNLPPYAPECNPIEWLWAWVKKSFFANLGAKTLDQLKAAWQRALEVARSRPELIRSFFAASAIKDVVKLL